MDKSTDREGEYKALYQRELVVSPSDGVGIVGVDFTSNAMLEEHGTFP